MAITINNIYIAAGALFLGMAIGAGAAYLGLRAELKYFKKRTIGLDKYCETIYLACRQVLSDAWYNKVCKRVNELINR